MKIVIVVLTLEMGGSEHRALTLARWFKQNDHDVEIWGLTSTHSLSKVCDDLNIDWKVINIKWFQKPFHRIIGIVKLTYLLRKAKTDILLSHTLIPNTACGLIWCLTGAKTCIGYEGGHEFGLAGRTWEKLAVDRMPAIICNARHLADEMTQYYDIDAQKVEIIPNGVDLPPAKNSRDWWRLHLGLEEDSYLAVMVANLSGYKNHEALLRAWQLVLDQSGANSDKAKLVLAGKNFGTEPTLRKLAMNLGIESEVVFAGYVEDISGLLQAADLGVYSSAREGCPNGILECMQMGLAIAASEGVGIREVVGEHQYPWLSPLNDDNAFAKNILALMENPGLRREIGEKNRERVENKYSTREMCVATERLIFGSTILSN